MEKGKIPSPESMKAGSKLVVEDLLRSSELAKEDDKTLCALFKGRNGNRLLQLDLQWRRMASLGGSVNITNYQEGGDLEGLLSCKLEEKSHQLYASARMTTASSLGLDRRLVEFYYVNSDGSETIHATCVVTSELHPQANQTAASNAMRFIDAQLLRRIILKDVDLNRMQTIRVECKCDEEGEVSIY